MIYGQNGIEQNGMDIMARMKCYGCNHKSTNQSHAQGQYDFFINPASTYTLLGFLCVFITYFGLLVTNIN